MGPAKKVLIIDDDELIRQAYATIVKSLGHEVATASDGQEGLAQSATFKPDLIILDIVMPVMDGLEFLKTFQPATHPETKILVLSNSAAPEKLKVAIDLGADEYMIKTDVKPEVIKTLVNGLLATNSS